MRSLSTTSPSLTSHPLLNQPGSQLPQSTNSGGEDADAMFDRSRGFYSFDPLPLPPIFTRETAGHWAGHYDFLREDLEIPIDSELLEREEEFLALRFANGSQFITIPEDAEEDYSPPLKKSKESESPITHQQPQPVQQLQSAFHYCVPCIQYGCMQRDWRAAYTATMVGWQGHSSKNHSLPWLPPPV